MPIEKVYKSFSIPEMAASLTIDALNMQRVADELGNPPADRVSELIESLRVDAERVLATAEFLHKLWAEVRKYPAMNPRDAIVTEMLLSGNYDLPRKPDANGYINAVPDVDWPRLQRDLAERLAASEQAQPKT